MKYVVLILVLLIAYMAFHVGKQTGYNVKTQEVDEAFFAFSHAPDVTGRNVLLYSYGIEHKKFGWWGFQYENKKYDVMTFDMLKELIRSQIFFDKTEVK